ncbi:hypothetical protein PMAC_001957 [Pneumocystis sp. 'macacae']|nr:hypothetical protein PMAC_001957 [Pneumocystis sp. 'macacae']
MITLDSVDLLYNRREENVSFSVRRRALLKKKLSRRMSDVMLTDVKCEHCGKGYKHIGCLSKHLWEHTVYFNPKLSISKHQQVQLLEAAAILIQMNQSSVLQTVPIDILFQPHGSFIGKEDGDLEVSDAFVINEEYARRYEYNKSREELHRYKYGSEYEDTGDSETEDEIGDLATPSMNAAILETIFKIRTRNPEIYRSDVDFYRHVKEEKISHDKSKPIYLSDYYRDRLLSVRSNQFKEKDDDDKLCVVNESTYVDEQRALKEEIMNVIHKEATDDNFLTLRKKNKEELEEEDEAYKDFLMNRVSDKAGKDILRQWIDVSNKILHGNLFNEIDDEKFLFSYVLNRGWIDKDGNRIASYDEVIKGLESDESFDEKVDEFEAKYNFRFEEDDANQIVSYSRNITSVRRKNEKRKQIREKKNQVKYMERLKKEEEISRLKKLKKKELTEKLKKIAEVTGDPTLKFEDIDIEGDFDPDRWSARMDEIFDEVYYNKKEKKPIFDDDIDITDIDPDYKEPLKDNIDVEVFQRESENSQIELGESTLITKLSKREKENRKKKLDSMLDQHYYTISAKENGLFKYQQVDPYVFGLSRADILYANDNELNEYVSLKKLTPYKNKELHERDKKKYGKKKRLKEWRKKIWGEHYDNQNDITIEKSNANIILSNKKLKKGI